MNCNCAIVGEEGIRADSVGFTTAKNASFPTSSGCFEKQVLQLLKTRFSRINHFIYSNWILLNAENLSNLYEIFCIVCVGGGV